MKNRVMREDLPLLVNAKANILRCEVYYSLGGMNFFTYKSEARGYYLSVSPLFYEDKGGVIMESYTAFQGTKVLLYPCSRKSAKSEKEAMKLVDSYRDRLIEHVLLENNLALAEGALLPSAV